MSSPKRFSGLMGSPDATPLADAPVLAAVPSVTSPQPDAVSAPSTAAETVEKKSKAKVQLNTQQPEELKNAVDKAAAYLSFTTGKKVTTTDVVERALRVYLETLPEAARGI